MTKRTPEHIRSMLSELDTMDMVNAKFEKARGDGGLGWAVEQFGSDVIYARQMTRLVQRLLEAYDERESDESWVEVVTFVRDEAMRQLLNGCWRSNSTSMMSNLIHQIEAEAMSKFIDTLKYVL